MPHADVGDLSMYYELHGTGDPVLNISGSGGDLRVTPATLSPLNDHLRVLHYDQRGLGRTSAGTEQPTMADFAADAARLIESVGWDRCHVVGTSFGGMVALELAVRYPDVVQRLALNCTSAGGSSASYPIHELEALAIDDKIERWLERMDTRYDPAADPQIPGFGGFAEYFREAQARPRDPDSARGFAQQLEARRHHDVTDRLSAITAPTLVSCGCYDGIAPPANSELIVDGIDGARLEVFDGGHAFMMQDPRASEVLVDFLTA